MGRESNCIFKGEILPLFAKWAQFSSILLTTVDAYYLKSGAVSRSSGRFIVDEKMFPGSLALSPGSQHRAAW